MLVWTSICEVSAKCGHGGNVICDIHILQYSQVFTDKGKLQGMQAKKNYIDQAFAKNGKGSLHAILP